MFDGYIPKWTNTHRLSWMSLNPEASVVVMGVPLDETTSFRPGTRFGPRVIRESSVALEDFSLRQKRELMAENYFDIGDLVLPMGHLDKALFIIQNAAASILETDRKFLALGGEHLITYPLVKAVAEKYPDVVVIQFDAHADLRMYYTGTKFSHATVMRRIIEHIGYGRLYQLGIRSAFKGELIEAWGLSEIHFHNVLKPLKSIIRKIGTRPIYLSIDIDVVDPAFAPGTGVPEPGGITSQEFLDAIAYLAGSNIVGVDLVEVAPAYDNTGQTGLLAAAAVRESLLILTPEVGIGAEAGS